MVVFQSVLDAEKQKQLNKQTLRKNGALYAILVPLLAVFGIFFILDGSKEVGALFCVMAVAVPLALLIGLAISHKKAATNMPLMSYQLQQTFTFDYQGVTLEEVAADVYKSSTTYRYSVLLRAEETATHFFLYISPTQSFVLAKEEIVQGSANEMADILARNLGDKFKTKR